MRVVDVVRGALVNARGQVLMVRKRPDAGTVIDGEWHLPGGKVNWTQDVTREWSIQREFFEETNIGTDVVGVLGASPLSNDGGVIYLTVYYRLETPTYPTELRVKATDEIDGIGWFGWAEAQTRMGRWSESRLPPGFWEAIRS